MREEEQVIRDMNTDRPIDKDPFDLSFRSIPLGPAFKRHGSYRSGTSGVKKTGSKGSVREMVLPAWLNQVHPNKASPEGAELGIGTSMLTESVMHPPICVCTTKQ